jgi:hypothetical protein
MKPKFYPEHLKLSVANLVATARQEAVLHPYPAVRDKAGEAGAMLRKVPGAVEGLTSKKEVVKALRNLMQPDIAPGESMALAMLIDAVNRNELDTTSWLRTLDDARKTYIKGLAAAARYKNEHDIKRWQWFRAGIAQLEGTVDEVNYKTLWELSGLAKLND